MTGASPPWAATVIYVAFGTLELDLGWIPEGAPVIVVHNDDLLPPPNRGGLVSVHPGANVGFSGGVNRALALVETARVILCNPDTLLLREHWDALSQGVPDEVLTMPLDDASGIPTSVINPYPTPTSSVASAYRLGRLAGRGSRRRRLAEPLLGRWGREHQALRAGTGGEWPLATHWASGAVVSVDTERLREAGGLDESYFLYFEDVDLCRRLAEAHPRMTVRLVSTPTGTHTVAAASGGTAGDTERIRLRSALTYARRQAGWRWRLAVLLIAPRLLVLANRRGRSLT